MKNFILLFFLLASATVCQGQETEIRFFSAIERNDTLMLAEMIKKGCCVNAIQRTGWVKMSPLLHAVLTEKIRVCEILIQNGADVNWRDGFQTTPLMYAASKGQEELVSLLLENGADVLLKDEQGNDALSAARESKNEKIIHLVTQAKIRQKLK